MRSKTIPLITPTKMTSDAAYEAWNRADYRLRHNGTYRGWSDLHRWAYCMTKAIEAVSESAVKPVVEDAPTMTVPDQVYKYPFSLNSDRFTLSMPSGAKVLHVDVQHAKACMWVRVNPGSANEQRIFRVAGTGHLLDDDIGAHVGSFMLAGGSLVFHVFEVIAP